MCSTYVSFMLCYSNDSFDVIVTSKTNKGTHQYKIHNNLHRQLPQIFVQGFDQGSGEGRNHKYYPALRKNSKTVKKKSKHSKTSEHFFFEGEPFTLALK